MQTTVVFILVALFLSAVSAFQASARLNNRFAVHKLAMADDDDLPEKKDASFNFNMNRIVRLGRSRDEVCDLDVRAGVRTCFSEHIPSRALPPR